MLINTIHGKMDDALLVKKEGSLDNENEFTTWVEYWLDDELVHRSAHVVLKKSLFTQLEAAEIG
jgi:hypothetical protein